MTQDSGIKSQPSRSAGKGSRPRPVRGSTYRDNYESIQWTSKIRNAPGSPRYQKLLAQLGLWTAQCPCCEAMGAVAFSCAPTSIPNGWTAMCHYCGFYASQRRRTKQ